MKPTDLIALLVGAIALVSLLGGTPDARQQSDDEGFFSIIARAAQGGASNDHDLRALCEEQRAITLKILKDIVDVARQSDEDRIDTIQRLNNDRREMLAAVRTYTETATAKVNKAQSEDLRWQLGSRTCPEMGRVEQRRFVAEVVRYHPALLETGTRFYPQIFKGVDPS